MKRKTYEPTEKMFDRTLTKMRDAVFGKSMNVHIHRTCDRSDRMRDDQGLIDAAQAKRDRRNEKRKAAAG